MGLIITLLLTSIHICTAADFDVWAGVWFKATVAESGFKAPVLPDGGNVVTERVKVPGNLFVQVNSCDISTTSCSLNVCALDFATTSWVMHPNITVSTLSGKALDFLTLLEFTFTESTGNTLEYRIPLRIKGTEDKKALNTIKSASVNSSGGLFVESVGTPVSHVGIGSLTLSGVFIPNSKVPTKVPADCLK